MPLISVIVPVYNVEKYLDRCIKSILNQTFRDFELIIIDDGSPDNSPELCDKWGEKDNRIIVVHQSNQGLSCTRNNGRKIAKGDYLTFVDSDDWIANDMLEKLFNLIKKYDADISICNFTRTDHECEVNLDFNEKETLYTQNEFMNIILKIHSNRTIHYAWGKLYKKNVIDVVEHFPKGMLNEDVEGMFKAVIHSNKIVETTYTGYFYYENFESITRKKFGENFLCLETVWKRILNISQKNAPQYTQMVNYNLMRSDFTILTDSLIYGNYITDDLYKDKIKEIHNRLKKNLIKLLKGPMVFKRKIILLFICCFYDIIKIIMRKRGKAKSCK